MEENQRKLVKNHGKKRRNMDILWITLMSICIVVMVVCIVILGKYYYQRFHAEKEYEKLRNEIHLEADPETDEEEEETDEFVSPIDFAPLWKKNEDIYAWLEVPGTAISYPVLQHVLDDEYYLEHNLDHSEGRPGVIYSERSSAKDFSGYINILYGHNMRNGTMFADLHKYEDSAFMEENCLVYVYTPEHIFTYEIFAAVVESLSLIHIFALMVVKYMNYMETLDY